MWVEAETQREFELHTSGSPRLPKGRTFAGNGKLPTKTPSQIAWWILYHITVFSFCQRPPPPKDRGHATSDKPSLLCLYRCLGRLEQMETPRQLSLQAIDEFKAIYEDEFDE